MAQKNRKELINFISEVLDVLFRGLNASPVARTSLTKKIAIFDLKKDIKKFSAAFFHFLVIKTLDPIRNRIWIHKRVRHLKC